MSECTHLERTSMYFDGELARADEADAVAHIATCAECQLLLGDAVSIDAALSRVARPAAARDAAAEAVAAGASASMAVDRRATRRRRWTIVAAAGALAVAAAILLLVLRPRNDDAPQHPAVLALDAKRSVEARFTGGRFASHRPYESSRDRAHEPISMDVVAKLEKHGEVRDVIAALASAGELVRAEQLAKASPDSADAQSDLAAIALASGDAERALGHAYRALARDVQHAAATWNLALATRQLRLWRVSRAAFARVAAKGEPGWAGEATAQIAALDRELGADAAIAKLHEQFRVLVTAGSVRNTILDPGNDMAEFQRRSRSILEDETPIELADVRRFPSQAWRFLYESLGAATPEVIEGLLPVAAVLDEASGTTAATAVAKRAVVERARFARASALVEASLVRDLTAAEAAELDSIAAPSHDPFLELFVQRARRDFSALERCTKDVFALPCVTIARDASTAFASDAARSLAAAEEARNLALATGGTPDYRLLSELHRKAGRADLARAEAEEATLAAP